MGIDDAMHQRATAKKTKLIGVVCQGTRMVGIVMDEIEIDGDDSTEALIRLIKREERHVQYVITDTITFGGFNIMDIARVHRETRKPIIAIIDRKVDMASVKRALVKRFPETYEEKLKLIFHAGNLYQHEIKTAGGSSTVYFHAIGIDISEVGSLLDNISIDSKQPECTRMAHLIGRCYQ